MSPAIADTEQFLSGIDYSPPLISPDGIRHLLGGYYAGLLRANKSQAPLSNVTLPVEDFPIPAPRLTKTAEDDTTDLYIEFRKVALDWKRETSFLSSLSDKFMHPAYQRIMAMGKPALPLILQDLRQNSGHWFHALRYIAGEDIAAGTHTIGDAKAAWLEWGYKNNYI